MKYFGFGHRINILARMFTKRLNEKFLHTGITSSQYPVIVRLYNHGKLTQNEICEQLFIEAPTISKTLDNMEKAGWVVRTVDEHDKRERRIQLTDKAREQFPIWIKLIDELQADILCGIASEDIAVFDRVIEQLQANLKKKNW